MGQSSCSNCQPGIHTDFPPPALSHPDAASIQGRQLLAGLEKVNSELDKQEKAITANLRPPLEQSRAVQDSAERSKDLKVNGSLWAQFVLLPIG